jgi:hypothetical protein
MPTRVERLENRKTKVRKKALSKMAKAKAAEKPVKKMFVAQRADRKLGKLNKKIVKTKARGVKKVEKLQERRSRVINKGTRGKSQAKSNAKIKAAVAKGKTKKAARIDKRQINKNMRTGSAVGKRLGKISKKIVKAGGPARVIKTGKKKVANVAYDMMGKATKKKKGPFKPNR